MRSLILLALTLISCSREGNMLSVLLNPKRLDQHLDTKSIPYTNDFYILENLTTRLLSLDEKGNYQMELASSFEKVSELEYAAEIRETYFSNGELITLQDVEQTFLRIKKFDSSHVKLSEILEDIEIKSKKIHFRLKYPNKSFVYYLSLPDLGVLHKSQYSKDTLKAADFTHVSSGPFVYSKKGEEFYLIKNSYYLVHPKTYPDSVKLLNYFKEAPHEMLLNGDADLGKVSVNYFLENRERFSSKDNLRVIGVPSSSLTYLYFNKYSEKFNKKSHRLWLKNVILKNFNVPKSYGWIARNAKQYFPPESKAFLQEDELKNDLSKIEIVKPSDFPSEIVIHTYSTAFKVTLEPLVKLLEEIPGVKIILKDTVDPSNYLKDMKEGRFDIFVNIMSTDFRTPVEAINFEFFSSESALHDEGGLIAESFKSYQKAKGESEEIKHLKTISSYLVQSDQVIPLFHSAIPYVYNSEKVNLDGLNHLFIFNFWKMKKK